MTIDQFLKQNYRKVLVIHRDHEGIHVQICTEGRKAPVPAYGSGSNAESALQKAFENFEADPNWFDGEVTN